MKNKAWPLLLLLLPASSFAYTPSNESAFSQDDIDAALRSIAQRKEAGLSESYPYHESVGQPFIAEMKRLGYSVNRVRVEGDKTLPCIDLCNSVIFSW